jgi:hypothetical protein
MTDDVPDAEMGAGGAETAPAPTNVDRLRGHLKSGGLAIALLDAWVAGDPPDAERRLMAALEMFHEPKQAINDRTEASED